MGLGAGIAKKCTWKLVKIQNSHILTTVKALENMHVAKIFKLRIYEVL